MDNIFLLAAVISFIYFLTKFIEMRFIVKQNKPLKTLFRDSLLAYFSVIIGDFIYTQFIPLSDVMKGGGITEAFTNNPDF